MAEPLRVFRNETRLGRVSNVLPLTLVLLSTSAQIGSPQHVRLVDDAPLLAQVTLSPVPMVSAPDEPVPSAQLQADLAALRKMRPSLGLPVTLIIVGGASALVCGFLELMIAGLRGFGGNAGTSPLIVAAVGASISLPIGTLGSWLLYDRLAERGRLDKEARALRLELGQQTGASMR